MKPAWCYKYNCGTPGLQKYLGKDTQKNICRACGSDVKKQRKISDNSRRRNNILIRRDKSTVFSESNKMVRNLRQTRSYECLYISRSFKMR